MNLIASIFTGIFPVGSKDSLPIAKSIITGYCPGEYKNMGVSDFIPSTDLGLNAWLDNFVKKCEIYEAELGLDSETFGEITIAAADFRTKLSDVNETKETLRGQVTGKDTARKSTVSTMRAFAKEFKAIPGIDPAILSALNIIGGGTVGPVTVVTGLTVKGCDDGVNVLKWNRNGNAQGTQFIIESSPNGSTLWDLVDVVTRTDYKHTNQVPGEKQYYRIRSKRAGITSQPSPAVVVYANGAGPGLQIAA
jgi:hypothetical protein